MVGMIKQPLVLYFINGPVPPLELQREVASYGGAVNCVFRNADYVNDETGVEKADAVAGNVPKVYDNYPRLADVLPKWRADLDKAFADPVGVAEDGRKLPTIPQQITSGQQVPIMGYSESATASVSDGSLPARLATEEEETEARNRSLASVVIANEQQTETKGRGSSKPAPAPVGAAVPPTAIPDPVTDAPSNASGGVGTSAPNFGGKKG